MADSAEGSGVDTSGAQTCASGSCEAESSASQPLSPPPQPPSPSTSQPPATESAPGVSGLDSLWQSVEDLQNSIGDYVEMMVSSAGLHMDRQTTNADKARSMVEAQRKQMADPVAIGGYGGAALVLCMLAGMVLWKRGFADKLLSLFLSSMWAIQGILIVQQVYDTAPFKSLDISGTRPQKLWPVESVVTGVLFWVQSTIIVLPGSSGQLRFRKLMNNDFNGSTAALVGLVLVCWALLQIPLHLGLRELKGLDKFFQLSFPLDAFTIGFLILCLEDSSSKPWVLSMPVLMMTVRTMTSSVNGAVEDFPLVLAGYWCWLNLNNWRGSRGRPYGGTSGYRGPGVRVKKAPAPMMKEIDDETLGEVQGTAFVKELLMVDEDGDEAMEFFEVTDEGLLKRHITTPKHPKP